MSSEDNLLPLIVEPEQLEARLGHPDLLIIDVPAKADSYLEGHVPGAVFLDYKHLLLGSGDVPNDTPSVEQLSALFSSLGWIATPMWWPMTTRAAAGPGACCGPWS